jgi:hypothetical protein
MNKTKQYRVENGSVYEYDKSSNSYVFCGKLNGRLLSQFKKDKAEAEMWDDVVE